MRFSRNYEFKTVGTQERMVRMTSNLETIGKNTFVYGEAEYIEKINN